MNTSFYRTWLPISLAAHALLVLLLNVVPIAVPTIGGDRLTPITIVEAAEPIPTPTPPYIIPPPPPAIPEPPPAAQQKRLPDIRQSERVKDVPKGRQLILPGTAAGTEKQPGVGKKSVEPGPGNKPTAPPSIMRSVTGELPGAPPGRDGGTGTQGTAGGVGGPSRGAQAAYGRKDGSSKAAGEINRDGAALFLVAVSESGAVTGVKLLSGSGSDDLDRIAERLVRAGEYAPALKNGASIAGSVRMRVQFRRGQYRIEEVKS